MSQPWAFESRDFLRALTVGKEISFTSSHSLPTNDDVPRDLGTAEVGGVDIASEVLKNGWAKVKELKRDPTEEDQKNRDLEAEAKAAGKGLWNPHGPKVRSQDGFVSFSFDLDFRSRDRRVPSTTRCLMTLRHL